MNLTLDFSVNKENKTITVKREFAAELAIVWDAYTKPELLDKWWAPKPWQSKTRSMNFTEGGSRHYAMVGPKGEEHWAFFNYETIKKLNYFSGKDGFMDANGVANNEMPQTHWKISFKEEGDKTLVEVLMTFESLEKLETLLSMGFKEGFTMAMQNLDEVLPSLKK